MIFKKQKCLIRSINSIGNFPADNIKFERRVDVHISFDSTKMSVEQMKKLVALATGDYVNLTLSRKE